MALKTKPANKNNLRFHDLSNVALTVANKKHTLGNTLSGNLKAIY